MSSTVAAYLSEVYEGGKSWVQRSRDIHRRICQPKHKKSSKAEGHVIRKVNRPEAYIKRVVWSVEALQTRGSQQKEKSQQRDALGNG